MRPRDKDCQAIRTPVERPADYNAQGDEGEKSDEACKEDDESGGHLK